MKIYAQFLLFIVFGTFFAQSNMNQNKGYVAEGYDVVAYFNNTAIEGKESFDTVYEGARYKFSTPENLAAFKKSPEKYVPQYGGYCAWAVADDAKKVGIDPESFQIREGKLFLFYDSFFAHTLKKWNNNSPEVLMKKGDENWEQIKGKE